MAWVDRDKAPIGRAIARRDTPDGLWHRCEKCTEVVLRKDWNANLCVCPKCQHHFYISAKDRIQSFLDPESFVEEDRYLTSSDPLAFKDSKSYRTRLKDLRERTRLVEAIVCGRGTLLNIPVQLGVFDFKFLGGSMGSVVGEKIARLFNRSYEKREAAIIVSSSGGARMQEGILSLMQMAKTCAGLAKLRTNGIPFISILSDPTTGGVAASFATLGDVNIGEPGALIGFAGPRVIQQTIREKLPEGFQRSEYLLEHGMLDMICHRDALRPTVGQILHLLKGTPPHP